MPDNAGAGGAEIVPFPGRLSVRKDAAGGALGQHADDAARLQRALQALQQAVTEQQEAVQAWRQAVGALARTVQELADSLAALDTRLVAATSEAQRDANEAG